MNSSLSRRLFLEGCVATLGLTIVGCNSGGTDGPLLAKSGENGSFVVENAPEIGMNEGLAFQFSGGDADQKAGLLFNTAAGLGAINAVCTHMGCIVEWTNDVKNPLRCPCHESKFLLNGDVVSGPAKKPLTHFTVQKQGTSLILTPA